MLPVLNKQTLVVAMTQPLLLEILLKFANKRAMSAVTRHYIESGKQKVTLKNGSKI